MPRVSVVIRSTEIHSVPLGYRCFCHQCEHYVTEIRVELRRFAHSYIYGLSRRILLPFFSTLRLLNLVLHTNMPQRGGTQQCICQICSLWLSLTCQRPWQNEQNTLERLLDDMWEQTRHALLCSQSPRAMTHMLRLIRKFLQALLELIFPASLKTCRHHKGLHLLLATALTLHGLILLRSHRVIDKSLGPFGFCFVANKRCTIVFRKTP